MTRAPWFVPVKFPFNEELRKWMRAVPGFDWDKEARVWQVPIEMLEPLVEKARALGVRVEVADG